MSRSASCDRLVCPTTRAAANIRPYIRAASVSNGNGSQVAVAHCSRSWRRARSSLSSVACGPADSSARVMAAIADSSGSKDGSIRSWSITTDVSSSPRVGSAIDALVDHSLEIRAESTCINPWRPPRGFGKRGSRHKTTRANGSQLCHGRAVARNDDRSSSLDLAQNSCGLIAQLPLSNDPIHAATVAHVAHRSKGGLSRPVLREGCSGWFQDLLTEILARTLT
jgi:hypothetical protein